MTSVTERLQAAGIELPRTFVALGSYVPAQREGRTVYVSGQTGTESGRPVWVGHVGAELGIEEARLSARLAAINALRALELVTGRLDEVVRVARTTVYVSAAPSFTEHPRVADAVTDVLETAFGPNGRGARSAIGVSSLPQGAPVEIDLVAIVRG